MLNLIMVDSPQNPGLDLAEAQRLTEAEGLRVAAGALVALGYWL
jgi:hypothetical protein